MPKLMLLMIDGVAADHYAADSRRFPHFAALERRGLRVERLHAEVLGTSLPGRTSILTGVTADVSGVYGNNLWDGEGFRYANPDDIRVPTLPARARAAGLKAAAIGMGMIRPEDTDIFCAPWWASGFIQRGRDAQPKPSDDSWLRVALHDPGEQFRAMCARAGIPDTLPMVKMEDQAQAGFFGVLADLIQFDRVAAVAAAPDAPDLILSEFLIPDVFQHKTGYRSDLSQWSVMQADAAVGRILRQLELAGVADEWNIAVLSDHGHSPIERALQPQVVIPGVRFQSEGSLLMVAPRDAAERAMVEAKLAEHGCEPYPNTCFPPELRETLVLFVAPDGVSFEHDQETTETHLPPQAVSSHGLRPGSPGDDRFALFAGPSVPQGLVSAADATQVAPTLAALLGLPLDGFPAAPIFSPR